MFKSNAIFHLIIMLVLKFIMCYGLSYGLVSLFTPASLTFGIIMFIVSIIMMVTTEPFPSEKVRNELNKEKVEYIQNYCIDHGLLTKRQKERLGLADN